MRYARQFSLAMVMSVMAFSVADAQRAGARAAAAPAQDGGFWEMGMDAALSYGVDDPSTISLIFPVALVRAGYFTSNVMAIEPMLAINSFGGQNQTGFTLYTFGVGVLYHLSPERAKAQTYVRPFLSVNGVSGSGGQSFTSVGFGAGMKRPFLNNRLSTRGEVNLAHRMESNPFPARTSLNGLFGLSVYSR